MVRISTALGVTLMSLVLGLAQPAYAAPVIAWRVENPFRFFTDPADTEVHRATYRALGPDERRTPILSAERALQARHDDGWAVWERARWWRLEA